jgi:AcrR family transcriptional regulator
MSAHRPSPTGVRARKVSPARLAKYRVEKDAIMRAAYELIQRNGSKETSVHDVLRETGYSTRAFYRHFRSKDELVLEMYRTDSDRVAQRLVAAVAAAATPLDALEAWIDQNLAVVYDARRLRHAAVLASSEVASAAGYIDVHLAGQAAQRAPLIELLRAGRQSGAFPFAEPEEDAFAVQAVVGAHMRVRMQHADTLTRAEARAHTLALFRRAFGA